MKIIKTPQRQCVFGEFLFFPTIYRVDRLQNFCVLDEHFAIPYTERFEEGEFRKRMQFMYGGKLRKVEFTYTGNAIDCVLDRFPTAKIIKEDNGKYIVSAEVFGIGVEIWIRGQGDIVTNVKYK